MLQEKIAFIGGGQMAAALITGALRSQILKPQQIVVIESFDRRRQQLQQNFPGVDIQTESQSAKSCSQIVLALKPHVLREIGKEIGKALEGDRLWISIAAGVSLEQLQALIGSQRIVRVMPNTPAQVGAGAAAITANPSVDNADIERVERLLRSVGNCVRVNQAQMHAVTGIAGSSPAYVYMIIEAMADGGVLGGLPREVALQLAAQSVLGAAKMVLDTGLHPGQLKDQVTSPAGTTIAAIRKLEAAGVRSALIEAVQAATARSRELEMGETK
jgi:pyrroline-5-carboxylate reductase